MTVTDGVGVKVGLTENAMYLLRPDTYVALAAKEQDPDILRRYFADRGLSLGDTATRP